MPSLRLLTNTNFILIDFNKKTRATGNEGVPKIITDDTIVFFLKLQSAFWYFQTITVSECCLTKLLPYN